MLPEMMRAEAESVMAVVPRDIPFEVRTPLELPGTIWQDGPLSSSPTAHDSPTTPGPSAHTPGRTSTSWARSRSSAGARRTPPTQPCDLELVRVENFNDLYTEQQRSDFSFTRFTVSRAENPGPDGWELPTGLPTRAAEPARTVPDRRWKAT
ncbi:hypothetical protein ACIQOU_35370 [Streptomyces sp. NPDC091279]|uniref:hypothetical protein n=1 Tax=unclassified Streptomyces TaxID=2593676 RepID=UPI003823DFFE